MWPEISVLDRMALEAVLLCQELLAGGLGPLPPGSPWEVPAMGTDTSSAELTDAGRGRGVDLETAGFAQGGFPFPHLPPPPPGPGTWAACWTLGNCNHSARQLPAAGLPTSLISSGAATSFPFARIDPLWHRGHQQLGPPHLPGARGACAGYRRLPGAHGGQVSAGWAGPLRGGLLWTPPLCRSSSPWAVGATTRTLSAA